MIIFIDTNLILDILQKRMPFYNSSNTVLTYCASGEIKGYISLYSISNLFYVLRNYYSTKDRKRLLLGILNFLQIADAKHDTIKKVLLRMDFPDFETCLQDECAKRVQANYIITRNVGDFFASEIPVLTPIDFLKKIENNNKNNNKL